MNYTSIIMNQITITIFLNIFTNYLYIVTFIYWIQYNLSVIFDMIYDTI